MSAAIQFLDNHSISTADLILEAEQGLLGNPATLSPKFFYDLLGSKLFDAITLLPEYYPTSTEAQIFQANMADICQYIGTDSTLVDLGSGNSKKAARFFDTLKPKQYIAVDISVDFLKEILPNLQNKYPDIEMMGVGMDFSSKLHFPKSLQGGKKTFFYPGSSLGNFVHDEAVTLLKQIYQAAEGGGLLIGLDLWKDQKVLQLAYDDPLKITAAFNLNILRTVNNLLDANFEVNDFVHHIEVNPAMQRVELYLEALRDVKITWPRNQRLFKKGERIHTEYSHKYSLENIDTMLRGAGFSALKIWTDPKQLFAVVYAH